MSSLPPSPMTLRGGCFCTAIKYTINVPEVPARPVMLPASTNNPASYPKTDVCAPAICIDHCDKCRRISGAVIQTWFICPQSWVTWDLKLRELTDGQERITLPSPAVVGPRHPETENTYVSLFISSEDVHRTFCSNCGTNLTFARVPYWRNTDNPAMDITMGSFDRESLEQEGVRPERHAWWSSGINWVKALLRDGDKTLCDEDGKRMPRHKTGAIASVISDEMD